MKKIVFILISIIITSVSYATPPKHASDVMKHLEFLGYDVSMDTKRIKAIHPTYLNIFIRQYRGGMLVTAFFGGSKYGKNNKDSWLILLNKLNKNATAAKYYIDDDGDMTIEAYYPGEYNKKSFSAFLDAFNLESIQLVQVADKIKKYLK